MIIPIPLRFSNAYLLKSAEKHVLIDTGCKGQHHQICRFIESKAVDPRSVDLIIHTHVHADHCGSTLELSRLLVAETLIHAYEYESLKSGKARGLIPHNWEGHLLKQAVIRWGVTFFEPDYVIETDVYPLDHFGINATILLTPGHTAGSLSIIDHDSNQGVIGDLLMGGYLFNLCQNRHPRFQYFIQDKKMIKWSMKRLLQYDLDYWHPGHGSSLWVGDIKKAFQHFLT